jgi:hypothetical protein
MSLHLKNYLHSDICNIVQELSKYMDSATWGTYNQLLRVIKFIIHTKTFDLKVKLNFDNILRWSLKIFCDSD